MRVNDEQLGMFMLPNNIEEKIEFFLEDYLLVNSVMQ